MEQEASLFMQASNLLKRVAVHELRAPDGIEIMLTSLESVDLLNADAIIRKEEPLPTVEVEA
jgi:hypothetical protein